MKDLFASIYENLIYNQQYDLVFQHLYDSGGYVKLGLIFLIVPLLCWLAFYFLWRFPYGKWWHWLIWLFVAFFVVTGLTYGIANTEIFASNNTALNNAISDSSTGYDNIVSTLPFTYSLINGLLSILVGFVYSLIMKQFSKIQIHLPF